MNFAPRKPSTPLQIKNPTTGEAVPRSEAAVWCGAHFEWVKTSWRFLPVSWCCNLFNYVKLIINFWWYNLEASNHIVEISGIQPEKHMRIWMWSWKWIPPKFIESPVEYMCWWNSSYPVLVAGLHYRQQAVKTVPIDSILEPPPLFACEVHAGMLQNHSTSYSLEGLIMPQTIPKLIFCKGEWQHGVLRWMWKERRARRRRWRSVRMPGGFFWNMDGTGNPKEFRTWWKENMKNIGDVEHLKWGCFFVLFFNHCVN